MDEHRVSSVQFVKWRLSDEQRSGPTGPCSAYVLDHPAYQAQAVLCEDTGRAIVADAD